MLTTSALTYVANAAWQVALVAIIAAACGRFFRTASARLRHDIYVGALVASVLAPLSSLVTVGVTPIPGLPRLSSAHLESGPAASRSISLAPGLATVCLALVGLTFAWRLLRLAHAAWRTRTIARAPLSPLAGEAAAVAARAAALLGVTRYRAATSAAVSGPITFGMIHPTIVLPSALAEPDAADLLAAAVGHELAHVRRHDFLSNLILELLVAALAFHPGAWFLKRRIDETRELACDELVADLLVERRTYARCLVRLASAAVAAGSQGYAMGAVGPPLLDERVRRLIDAPGPKRPLPLALAAVVLALVTIGSARWAFAFSLTTSPLPPVAMPVAVDWFMEGLSACAAGDTTGADEAYGHLPEIDRAALADHCAQNGLGHCSAGFSRHDY